MEFSKLGIDSFPASFLDSRKAKLMITATTTPSTKMDSKYVRTTAEIISTTDAAKLCAVFRTSGENLRGIQSLESHNLQSTLVSLGWCSFAAPIKLFGFKSADGDDKLFGGIAVVALTHCAAAI